jgi:hypothetical protein
MTNENSANDPAEKAAERSSSQSSSGTAAPKQSGIRTDTEETTGENESIGKELAREFRWFEFASLLINGLLAFVGIIALCVYHGQLTVMRGQLTEIQKQYPELQKSADAAKDGADFTTQQAKMFFDTQRPWVYVKMVDSIHLEAGKPITAPVEVINYGGSPAIVRAVIRVEIGPTVIETFRSNMVGQNNLFLFTPESMGDKQIVIFPGEGNGRKDFPVECPPALSQQQYEKIKSGVAAGTAEVAVDGRIFYNSLRDPVGQINRSDFSSSSLFCFYLLRDGTTSACPDQNGAYTNFTSY